MVVIASSCVHLLLLLLGHAAYGQVVFQDAEDEAGIASPQPKSADGEGSPCVMSDGAPGRCRLADNCAGAAGDPQQAGVTTCHLSDSQSGVCCPADVTTASHVRLIIDGTLSASLENPAAAVPPAVIVDEAEAEDILRFNLATEADDIDVVSTTPTASGEKPIIADDEQVNFVDDTEPNEFHLRFNTPRAESLAVDAAARALLETTRRIKEANNLTDLEAGIGLRSQFNSDTSDVIDARCPWTPAPTCDPNQVFRSVDGSCNNVANPNFGRAGTPYQRILLPEYASGTIDLPRRRSSDNFELPSAREVSNMLTAKNGAGGATADPADPTNSVLVMQMGQFIDHDLTHTPNHGVSCCTNGNLFPDSFDADQCFPIQMFPDDPFWRGRKTCMSFARSLASPSLKCSLQTREQLNQITHWLDGSNIYGSTLEEAMHLRAARGQLKMSAQAGARAGSLPSCAAEQTGKVTGCDVCGSRKNDCFFAGDFRVNEQINLIVLHTLFMREHNRVAAALARLNPGWTDDRLYQEARRITVAEYQHIIYNEWLPIVIGKNLMTSYGLLPLAAGYSKDYMDNFDPRITNEFATAAFRFGHSMVPAFYSSLAAAPAGRPTADQRRSIKLADIFFKPTVMREAGFLDSLVRGMSQQAAAAFDNSFVADLRNNLFESAPGRGGLDLVAINVQRGRDHGLPGYNKYREICLGQKAVDWADFANTIAPEKVAMLKIIYKTVDDVDLYVGGFLESPHEDAILGPIFKCILGDQFARLKKGDRFFYDLGVDSRLAFSPGQLEQLRRTSLARIICDNTDRVTSIQPLAFKLPTPAAAANKGSSNPVRPCSDPAIPTVDLSLFREQLVF